MAALQQITLDPVEVAVAGRVELPLEGEGLTVYYEGLDFGEQEVKQFLAEGLFGSTPIDHVWPPRTIKIPLVVRQSGATSFDDVRVKLEAKVAIINEQGGWLKRTLPSGRYVFADITEAKLHLASSWLAENRDIDHEATLELVTLPEFYGPEIVGSAHEGTGDLAFTMQVEGELPARVTNMQVEDLSGNAQQGLMWHYRRRHYSSASTAEWAYDAEALGPLDIAAKVTLAGSYGTKVVEHPKLSTAWTPILSTNKGGTTFLTHTGLYTVWARVFTTSPTTSSDLPWLRLVYGVGDIVAPAENVQVRVPGKEAFYLVNLGHVNISALPFGAQRWEGVIQGRGELGGENVAIDRLWLRCDDECSGTLGALQSSVSLTSTDASDSLVGTGALSSSEATRGGKWEESGAAGGFERSEAGAKREKKEDSEGRTALLSGSTIGPVVVRCELATTAPSSYLEQGVYLRYFSSSYWVQVLVILANDPALRYVYLEYREGGSRERVFLGQPGGSSSLLEAEVNAGGEVTVRYNGGTYRHTLPATFRKGEAHAEGKVGIYDYNQSSTACTRTYRYFVASSLAPSDTVMYADKSAYLSTNGMYRESEDGLGASPIGHPGADLPRLPVSGPEEAPVEVAAKPSRGQFGELADSGKDALKVQVAYRPCYASIPES